MAKFSEEGIVLSTQDRTTTVKITPKGICPDSHVGCPVKALAEGREFITEAVNPINAQVGQRVLIEIETPHFYKGLTLVFIMPLIFLFMGYLLGIFITRLINKKGESLGYIFMAVGFISSFIPMARYGKKFSPKYTITKFAEDLA